ncbi:hypothetical protein KI811_04635 [Geobacter hydrogenophilus]|nr:hypothetical protein [Geobacter hydrogenophilus]MBT0893107.1 hypothetical protein [Geobacter hydrogenophilus]
MKRTFIWMVFPLMGAILFWGIDALVMAHHGTWSTTAWITAKSIALPVACGSAFWQMVKLFSCQDRLMGAAMAMATGIWVSGPLYYIYFHLSFGTRPMSTAEMLFHIALFPIATLMVSLFNGSIGGLLITSALLGILGTGWLGIPGQGKGNQE